MATIAQQVINELVLKHFNTACEELWRNYAKGKRLRSCTAWVHETENYFILRSYNTYIAAISKSSGVCYDALRHEYGYTSTSNQHICKFWHDYGDTSMPRLTYR